MSWLKLAFLNPEKWFYLGTSHRKMLQIWSFSNKWLHEIGYILVALSGLLDSNLHHILLDISRHWTRSIILVLNQLTERNSSLLQHTEKLYHPKGKKRFWLIIENLKLSQSWKMLKSTTHKNSRNASCYELSISWKWWCLLSHFQCQILPSDYAWKYFPPRHEHFVGTTLRKKLTVSGVSSVTVNTDQSIPKTELLLPVFLENWIYLSSQQTTLGNTS